MDSLTAMYVTWVVTPVFQMCGALAGVSLALLLLGLQWRRGEATAWAVAELREKTIDELEAALDAQDDALVTGRETIEIHKRTIERQARTIETLSASPANDPVRAKSMLELLKGNGNG